ncbi:hypothetical protein I3842_12G030800 [Carya illinoinensis]|uniref:Uncharacterized protein n=1 Tax=Carya illinoinensis TaxID=32201 RepID=A0A922IVU9_CARIL|nr:hypothetical protein I3842_12G030800 [Carya illinoinensis]
MLRIWAIEGRLIDKGGLLALRRLGFLPQRKSSSRAPSPGTSSSASSENDFSSIPFTVSYKADIEVENEIKVVCKRECHLQERKEELQKWKEELQNDRDEFHALVKDINHARMRPCVYWGLTILIFCYWIGSSTITY